MLLAAVSAAGSSDRGTRPYLAGFEEDEKEVYRTGHGYRMNVDGVTYHRLERFRHQRPNRLDGALVADRKDGSKLQDKDDCRLVHHASGYTALTVDGG